MPDSSRREFLGAAAALTTLPATGAGDAAAEADVEVPATQECDVCGAEKPASLIDRTTVEPIEPMEADICRVCQHVQDHELPDERCMKCGDEISSKCYLEVHYPLGPADLPAMLTGTLCGDCAGWVACDINYDGIDADDDAHETYVALLDEENEQRKELEGQHA